MSELPVSVPAASAHAPGASRVVRFVGVALTGGLLVAAGLVGGWVAARQSASGGAAHAEEGEAGEAHARAPRLSAQTLANLGVEARPLEATDFVRSREVPAVVEARPDARRPLYTPVGGTLRRVRVRQGQVVRANEEVAEVVRDAYPRPALTLTEAVLKPLNEDFHRSIADLRTSAQARQLAREELDRIRRVLAAAGGTQSLPGKAEIDLVNEERRALRALENARYEARRHGLSDEEIAALEEGTAAPPDQPPAQRILERNRLWSAEATEILGLLSDGVRSSPYAMAVLGELSGAHVLSAELVASLRARPALANAFLDLAGLLQQGATVAVLEGLEAAGALDAVVVLHAPSDAPDWDVGATPVRAGARVEPGAEVAELVDARRVRLRLSPAGPDAAVVERALSAGEVVTAEPLVAGAGPLLAGLHVARLDVATSGGASSAIVELSNAPLAAPADGSGPRTWSLREGVRYVVNVPLERKPNRFVLPADAVVPRGPDFVMVLADGASWRLVPVRVEHSDARVVVVANDGAVFPGDVAVVKGAYALSLALQAGSGGGGGGHAGHDH